VRLSSRRAQDINETILLGDPAGGDTFEESLNKIIAKVAYVRKVPPAEQKGGRWPQWAWHDGSPLDPELRTADMPLPPLLPDSFSSPPGCSKFYNVKELKKPFAKSFASDASPGSIYRDEYNQLKAAMKWPEDFPIDSRARRRARPCARHAPRPRAARPLPAHTIPAHTTLVVHPGPVHGVAPTRAHAGLVDAAAWQASALPTGTTRACPPSSTRSRRSTSRAALFPSCCARLAPTCRVCRRRSTPLSRASIRCTLVRARAPRHRTHPHCPRHSSEWGVGV
jgi:hypothetical protein